jgi:signal recognition particle receptor subunit alpha
VELFERGYGKDAAGIAKEAITFGSYFFHVVFLRYEPSIHGYHAAKENDFDVVLIDTAGRMQDNEVRCLTSSPLMLANVVVPSRLCGPLLR